jgi:lipoyl(octanoyl) transferase
MALDHALMRRAAATGEAVLRVYSWRAPTLSLGRHQPAMGLYDIDVIRAAGIDIVRRPTGGRAVLHHREVTYSITAPTPGRGSGDNRLRARDLYASINALLVEALRQLGVPAMLAPPLPRPTERGAAGEPEGPPRPSAHPCFDVATEGEVIVGGRKLVGSAQRRDPDAVLQHGSILIADDQERLGAVSRAPVVPAPVATLSQLLDREPSVAEVAAVLRDALDSTLLRAGSEAVDPYTDDPATLAAAAVFRTQYARDAWTWRH